MDSQKHTAGILNNLYEQGVRSVRLSTDPIHRAYVKSKGLFVNYDFWWDLMNHFSYPDPWEVYQISSELSLDSAGSGAYILPIGRARELPWLDRIKWSSGMGIVSLNEVKKELKEEFTDWHSSLRHRNRCFCGVTDFYLEANSMKRKRAEFKHFWYPFVGLDLSASFCTFNILPPVGNFKDLTADQVYQRAANNRLYQIMATEGPQGLAVEFTGKDKEAFREQFIERTPCGLCEDLMAEYPDKTRQLLCTPAQI